jgi:hypothetical protein
LQTIIFLVICMSIGAYLEPAVTKTAGGIIQLDGPSEAGSLITAAGIVATSFRLPPINTVDQDFRFTFLNLVGQNMAILPPLTTGITNGILPLIAFNNLAANSLTFQTAGNLIGACATARSINGRWVVINSSQNTATIA